jgi:hypothetical protein
MMAAACATYQPIADPAPAATPWRRDQDATQRSRNSSRITALAPLDPDRYQVATAFVTALRWLIVSPMFEAVPTDRPPPDREAHPFAGHFFMRQRIGFAGIFRESTRAP